MKNTDLKHKNLIRVAVVIATIAGLSALVVTGRSSFRKKQALDLPIAIQLASNARNATQLPRTRAAFESELITVKPHGFEPTQITRQQGVFALMVEDRSGLRSVSLELRREGGERVVQLVVLREQPEWSGAFNLPPGRYFLTEANHPRWSCQITVTR